MTLQSTATLEPTRTTTPTVVPTATPIPEPTRATCLTASRYQRDITLPDLATLHWETLDIDEHRVRHLAGLDYPVFPIDPSPDGRWLVVAFEIENSTGRAAMAVMDTQGNAHWWMNSKAYFFSGYFVDYPYLYTHLYPYWLPDGRLLWVDEGRKVFVGDGQNRRDLGAPERMERVRYASDGIAFAQSAEDGDLWRVDLASGMWEEVTTPRPPRAGTLGGSFFLAQDGSYALAFQEGQMWRIPAEMGAVAEPLPDVKVEIVGRGGPSGPPSTQLAGSPYWLLGLPRAGEVGVGSEGFVVNERDGSIITARDLQLPEGYYIIGYYTSPDGRWLAVIITDDRQRPWERPDVYITPSIDFTAGGVVEGVSVAGWDTAPPAVILRDNATDTLSVAQLPLSDGSKGILLNRAGEVLTALSGTIFTTDADEPARVLQVNLDGKLLNTLDLSAQYDSIKIGTGATDRVFLSVARGQDGTCTFALVEWPIGP